MSDTPVTPSKTPAAPPPLGERLDPDSFRTGPKIAQRSVDELLEIRRAEAEGASWRGWLIGMLAVGGIGVLVPYADLVLQASWLSFNSFPMLSVVALLGLILAVNLGLRFMGSTLGLTRQDLTLVFCMTVVVYSIPAVGFWAFLSTGLTGGYFHAKPENRWIDLIHPHMPAAFFPHDPADPSDPGPRPVEWFYTGLPPGQEVPWLSWVGPYWRWCIVAIFMYGIWFSVAMLLLKRWSEQERLPFPVAQVPMEILGGYGQQAHSTRGFLSHPLAWAGMGLTFFLHSWNWLATYSPHFPEIPLMNWNLHNKYFTEPPWQHIGTLSANIYPSIVGLTYLLSLEVAFSLWFFYFVVKALNFTLAPVYGQSLLRESYNAQGTGAVLALVVFGFWLARKDLGGTFLQAVGLRPTEKRPGEISPRAIWVALAVSVAGVVMWLEWFGVPASLGFPILLLFVLVMTGMTRLIAEAGLFAAQFHYFPVQLLETVATPAALGAKSLTLLTIWDRLFSADWYRVIPMPHIMNSLHFARLAGLRMRTAVSGMALAIGLMLAVSFFSFLGIAYTQGGANLFGWFFNPYPQQEFSRIGSKMAKLESWEKKQAEAAAKGKAVPKDQVPKEAQHDWRQIGWIGFGSVAMVAFLIVRRILFWWPHPAGYALWVSVPDRLWFSFFLGWLFKFFISKFGGMRIYLESRRFFIGMVAGECLAAIFWILISYLLQYKYGYAIKMG